MLKVVLRERPEYIIVGEIRSVAYGIASGNGNRALCLFNSSRRLCAFTSTQIREQTDRHTACIATCSGSVYIQIQTRINGRRVRRTKQIVEIVGIDPNPLEVITNEVFRWNVANDDFIFSGKSYVLEKIMVKINFLSQDEMRREPKNAQENSRMDGFFERY